MKLTFNSNDPDILERTFSQGSTILYQGEVPRSAHILNKGVIRVFSISDQGDEQIINFHVPGEFFPVAWIFDKAPSATFFYEALTDCEIQYVAPETLKKTIVSSKDHTQQVLDYFATNYTATQIRINGLEQPKARNKIIYTLYYLCQRYGQANEQATEIPITLTHQQFAALVGLTRETTAVEMNKLKKEKILSYHRQRYEVNMNKLLELIGEETFKNIAIS